MKHDVMHSFLSHYSSIENVNSRSRSSIEHIVLLMPSFQAIAAINLMRTLAPLGPSHPRRLRTSHNTNHLLRNRQTGINGRRKGMDEFGVVMFP